MLAICQQKVPAPSKLKGALMAVAGVHANGLPVAVTVGVFVRVGVRVGPTGVLVRVGVRLGVVVAVNVGVREAVAVAVSVGARVAVGAAKG